MARDQIGEPSKRGNDGAFVQHPILCPFMNLHTGLFGQPDDGFFVHSDLT